MIVAMFRRIVLEANLNKTKSMVCSPGFIWVKWGEHDYKRRETGEGSMFRERKRMQVSCTKCGVTVASLYLKHHMAILH